ncbi:DUF3048 domain-containing protein [Halobacillus sp. A5]|uniref:DUF3048 domain-containing protein n=1 Tax=Halobacillus sp. A5 TaxID=2880263 RepID=UPI0020A6AFED|nr:DUF3048 domain-containing protein [Halobacillus sp. A5]MCP3028370.1 DUF3048 domain-containing protein [Halobacillus sp. A5]
MRKLLWFSLVLLFSVLAACSNNESKSNEAAEEPSQEEKEEPSQGEKEEPPRVYPLTGEETDEDIDQRVVSVMVNNHSQARPQSGLSQADVVYEFLAEGQITRFLALYQSDLPENVGPVRSARPYFYETAEGYDALYTYHGAADFINDDIEESGIDYADGAHYDNDRELFKRTSDRQAPHNSYLITNGLEQLLQSKGYKMEKEIEPLPFSDEADVEGTPAGQVTVTYDENETVTYTYDEDKEQYLRESDGEPTIDAETNEQVALENVLIVQTSHEVIDDAGRREIDLNSGGKGYLLQKGEQLDVEWKNTDGRILPYQNDEPVPFKPGQTWVNVVPDEPGMVSVNEKGGEANAD